MKQDAFHSFFHALEKYLIQNDVFYKITGWHQYINHVANKNKLHDFA